MRDLARQSSPSAPVAAQPTLARSLRHSTAQTPYCAGFGGVGASTVTLNCRVAVERSAPLAVTVIVASPSATDVTVIVDPATLTVATPGADDALPRVTLTGHV